MAKDTPAELRERLAQELPAALVPVTTRSELVLAPPQHGKPPLDTLLVTDDAVVHAERIVDVALYLRDQLGYELLTNLTAVDYLHENLIELVYHFAHFDGNLATVKVRVSRDEPMLPSLTPFWPGADFQEREAYDLYGVVFDGHPNLRRIYMWDEFEGFPMRKDFVKQGDKYFGEGE